MDMTPQVSNKLLAMTPSDAANIVRYLESIERCPGDHPQSWPTSVAHVWATEFLSRSIRYRRAPGGGPMKVMSINP